MHSGAGCCVGCHSFSCRARKTHDGSSRWELAKRRYKWRGNLKYDVRAPKQSRVAELIRSAVGNRPVVVAGSTVEEGEAKEEILLMQCWPNVLKEVPDAVIVVAPRHPERFAAAYYAMKDFGTVRATELLAGTAAPIAAGGNILLDTIGDLAAVYELASVAFVGWKSGAQGRSQSTGAGAVRCTCRDGACPTKISAKLWSECGRQTASRL